MQPNGYLPNKTILSTLTLFISLLFACSKPTDTKPPQPSDPAPQVHSFTPSLGPVGTVVVITGTAFGTDPGKIVVQFNGTNAAVTAHSATSITVTVPTGATSGKISVARDGNTGLSENSFAVTVPNNPIPQPAWTVLHFAGTGNTGSTDGAAHVASFRTPKGMAVDPAGNLYVADAANNKIRKVTPQGVVSTYAGTGVRGMTNGDSRQATFNNPVHVALDGQGNLFVADAYNHAIRKITPAGVVSTYAGTGAAGYTDGTAANAKFSTPYGLVVDDAGNVYVGDHANHRIRKITPEKSVTTIAGNGSQTSTNGTGTAAGIPWPGGLALDKEGNLYVGEKGAGRVRRISSTGQVTTLGGYLSVSDGPCHLVLDRHQNLYVVYRGLHKIVKYTKDGVASHFVGTGDPGNNDGAQGSFRHPEGLALVEDAQSNLIFYVADTDNRKIRKVKFE